MLDNKPNQPTKFKTKNWVVINDESRRMYNEDNQIRFETSILRSSLCDYRDAYILVKGTIAVAKETEAAPNNAKKKLILKNCVPFTSCISRLNNTQIDDAPYICVVMSMYNLTEYSDNYSKTSAILWQYCRDEPSVDRNGPIVDFTKANDITDSFKIKEKITEKTGSNGTKNVEIMVPLKHLSNFWRTLEMPLINFEINLDLKWSEKCVIVATNVAAQQTFSITDTKLCVPVVTLSTQDNAKLLEQLKSGFKRTINCYKYQQNVSAERINQYLDFLIDPSFQGVYRLFVL